MRGRQERRGGNRGKGIFWNIAVTVNEKTRKKIRNAHAGPLFGGRTSSSEKRGGGVKKTLKKNEGSPEGESICIHRKWGL